MSWSDILGQEFAITQLRGHISAGRVAQAYLLSGPHGVGRRKLAWEFAKTLNCEGGAKPCDACRTCTQIAKGTHPDLHLLEPEGAAGRIKIEPVRAMLGRIALRPFSAATHVVIIDGAERLTEEAANALLKSLEEPSASTKFMLITAALSQCLPTIISRCQLIRCRPLAGEVIAQILSGHGADPADAVAIARLAQGSAARALTLQEDWAKRQTAHQRMAEHAVVPWLTQPLPEKREDVARLLDVMMACLRDEAAAPAPRVDREQCVETALGLIELQESLEQFVSPRLVAAVARERWLSLIR